MISWIKAWWSVYITGVVTPPEEPEEHLTAEDLLKKMAAEVEEEWEDDLKGY